MIQSLVILSNLDSFREHEDHELSRSSWPGPQSKCCTISPLVNPWDLKRATLFHLFAFWSFFKIEVLHESNRYSVKIVAWQDIEEPVSQVTLSLKSKEQEPASESADMRWTVHGLQCPVLPALLSNIWEWGSRFQDLVADLREFSYLPHQRSIEALTHPWSGTFSSQWTRGPPASHVQATCPIQGAHG